MGIIVGILGLAALIVIHEAGHFLAARLFGMRVLRFSVGFFKPIFQWKPRGSETTYSVGILPLGGYVQVDGLSPVDEVDPEEDVAYGRTRREAPEIDGRVKLIGGGELEPGDLVEVEITAADDYDLEARPPS